MEKIPVFLTPEEAALFVLFMQHYDKIAFLIAKGVFDLRQGNATLNFDRSGELLSIDKHTFEYRSKLSPLIP